jgi:hypothetical protein
MGQSIAHCAHLNQVVRSSPSGPLNVHSVEQRANSLRLSRRAFSKTHLLQFAKLVCGPLNDLGNPWHYICALNAISVSRTVIRRSWRREVQRGMKKVHERPPLHETCNCASCRD